MADPKLAGASSGFGGRGYKDIFRTGEYLPSVTTALSHLDKPGILHWSCQQVAAHAAVNAERLLEMSEERAYGYLEYYGTRLTGKKIDDPMFEFENAHVGVLNDLGDLGTFVHEWIEADLNDWIEPDIYREDQEQMIVSYLAWKADQDIKVHRTEGTVFGTDYAGTADVFWELNGVHHLTDFKTSRKVRKEHVAQLAALSAADVMAREVPKGTPGAVEFTRTKDKKKVTDYWVADVLPPVQAHSVLHIRPDDFDKNGYPIDSFAKLITLSDPLLEKGHKVFRAALAACYANTEYRQLGIDLNEELF